MSEHDADDLDGNGAGRSLRGTAAAVYLLRRDGAALLQLRDEGAHIPHAGTWVPPGGHCERGERLEACARRELLEETDYRPEAVHLLTRFVDDHVEGFEPLDLAVYWAAYDGAQRVVCREGQDLVFVARRHAERLRVPEYLVELWDAALAEARRTGALPAQAASPMIGRSAAGTGPRELEGKGIDPTPVLGA